MSSVVCLVLGTRETRERAQHLCNAFGARLRFADSLHTIKDTKPDLVVIDFGADALGTDIDPEAVFIHSQVRVHMDLAPGRLLIAGAMSWHWRSTLVTGLEALEFASE